MVKAVRFNNLIPLMNDMESKGWIIDSFPFKYKGKSYVVILKLYAEKERRPGAYAKCKLEFVKPDDNSILLAYADFYEVSFGSVKEFADFFGMDPAGAGRDVFLDFSVIFAKFIPDRVLPKNEELKKIQGMRSEPSETSGTYCYDVRRNRRKNDGSPGTRSKENDNKARILRPELYERYKEDRNLSFFFSTREEDELQDWEIINLVASRNH